MRKGALLWAPAFLTAFFVLSCAPSEGHNGDPLSSLDIASMATYTAFFNPCNGKKAEAIKAKAGSTLQAPNDPYLKGHSFEEWCSAYDAATGMGKRGTGVSFPRPMGEGNLVYYARYTKREAAHHTEEEIAAYMDGLKKSSAPNHLYYHYYRYDNVPENYADWDVWAWSYRPEESEGVKFDWEKKEGKVLVDDFGGASIDVDLGATYSSGWDSNAKKFLSIPMSFSSSTKVGLQIVRSSSRFSGSGFWTNDGSNLYVTLSDYALPLESGGNAYHVFVLQDQVQSSVSPKPIASASSPFEKDDGTNVTYGDSRYDDIDWSKKAAQAKTASSWKDVGTGYQIMVSSFADSDGDGFGDLYGIEQKLDYLSDLGVKALWLTPIQLSDSYHGYDIADYAKVDPKFGSSRSPSALSNGGVVSEETAMADYLSLLDAAHKRGMKVVMDLVLNHTSTSNDWFVKSANLDSAYRGYYQWGNHETDPTHINEKKYWYPYGEHPYSYYAKFGSGMPELNYSYSASRKAVIEMSKEWVRKGVDGFRLDAVKHLFMKDEVSSTRGDTIVNDVSSSGDYSSDLTKNLHFFAELNSEIKALDPDAFFVGENFDGHAYHVAPYYEDFDSMFDFYSYFNLTSAAATGRKNTTNGYGTAQGFLTGSSSYTVAGDRSATSGIVSGMDNAFQKANGKAWNFIDVYKTYGSYRGDDALPGLFTSNHDIARVINRVAGSGDGSGIQRQGSIDASTYASYEQSALAVKLAELFFPGVTWIYYGDEIGLTGNLPEGKDAESGYADLAYRQPMKWAQGQKAGDGSMATEFSVTGSGLTVSLDALNASSSVPSAKEQQLNPSSTFSAMKKAIALRAAHPALRTGAMEAASYGQGSLAANVLSFTRTLGQETLKIAVNFNGTAVNANGLEGETLFSHNGATSGRLPAYSAIVVKA